MLAMTQSPVEPMLPGARSTWAVIPVGCIVSFPFLELLNSGYDWLCQNHFVISKNDYVFCHY